MKPVISIIIVTYNSADYIQDCINAVLSSTKISPEIFVVDNASADDTVDRIRSHFPDIHVIANPNNLGFGAANNLAIKAAKTDLVLLLNPDTVVYPESIGTLADFLNKHPEHSMVGPYIENADGSHQDSVSYKYPSQKFAANAVADLPGEIASILGACIMIRRSILNEINGFDEDFFLYGEDQDLCIRSRKLGYPVGYFPDSRIMHQGGLSEQFTPRLKVIEKKLNAEFLFYRKHYPLLAIQRIIEYKLRLNRLKLFLLGLSLLLGNNEHKAGKRELYRFVNNWLVHYNSNHKDVGAGNV